MGDTWKSIDECDAFTVLQELAKKPFDLSAENGLTPERMKKYICKGADFDLLYGCQRINEQVIDALQLLADQCQVLEQFKEMCRGRVMNRLDNFPSEDRQVLHTACRDIFSDKPVCEVASLQSKSDLAQLKLFLSELDQGGICNESGLTFTTLIHVGIGGSDLGPRSIYEALRPYSQDNREVFFVSNVDPDDSAAILERVDLSRTLVLVVSKSGTTLETLSNETLVRTAFKDAGLNPALHCLAVTGKASPMDNPNRYLRTFYMYDYIGGRFSSTSMVGAVMLGFALGYEQLIEFLQGASELDKAATQKDLRANPALLLAMLGVWNRTFLGMNSVAVLPYSQGLHRFPAHLQQCDMESNGKSIKRNSNAVAEKSGPIIWGEPGTNGQHAFYQLLHQGTEDIAVEFIGFRESQRKKDIKIKGSSSQQKLLANLLAQSMALAVGKNDVNPNKRFPGNKVNSILIADQLTPKSMGALLALYEAKIVFQGFCWNVNSFDQEGVQLGKILADEILLAMNGNKSDRSLAQAFLDVACV